VRALGQFLERLGTRLRNAGYLLRHPSYGTVRRSGGARDLYQLLNKAWVRSRAIDLVIDVGANEGQFLTTAAALFPKARKVAFEPNPAMVARLRERFPGLEVHDCACGAAQGRLRLNVTKFAPSASLLASTQRNRELFPGTEVQEQIEVAVEPLDDFPNLKTGKGLLKLDVQGAELEVLKGATETLRFMEVVVCEVGLEALYDGQAELEQIVGFLRQHRFSLVDFAEPIRNEMGEAVYLDLAFAQEVRT
jgi:FkbM family methyltransferase